MSAELAVRSAVAELNACWLEGRPEALASFLHPDVILVLPGFGGRVTGRDAVLEGFLDFCTHARVVEYEESDHQVDLVDGTAITSYRFRMLYERGGRSFLATGRDLWVLVDRGEGWSAAWRTMLEVEEEPVEAPDVSR